MTDRSLYGKWLVLETLGRGGQGQVFLVLDTAKVPLETAATNVGRAAVRLGGQGASSEQKSIWTEMLRKGLDTLASAHDPANMGALKVLSPSAGGADITKAVGRFLAELGTYASVCHPNVLTVLEANEAEQWYVSEYFPARELLRHQESFVGNAEAALLAFRGLVDGVAALHAKNIVHRDIKPANIFMGKRGQLVLGDAGLAFYLQAADERLTETLENVGTREWMAPWLMGRRSKVSVSADLFSLGKVLWWMVSGLPMLQLWYHREEDEFNLEKRFPREPAVQRINSILDAIVVEKEAQQTIRTAADLLTRIDDELHAIRGRAQLLVGPGRRVCQVCGVGKYELLLPGAGALNFSGLRTWGCEHCGHMQIFRFGQDTPPAWRPPGAA